MKARLMERLQMKGFTVREIHSPVDFLKAWNAVMVPPQDPVTVLTDPITTTWLDPYANVRWIPDDGGRSLIMDSQLGFTGVSFALAETGTVVLAEDSGYGRLVSNMVTRHVALIPENRIVENWEEALQTMRRVVGRIPRIMSFISGPSQTADIQGTLVRGMHGPVQVEAWIVPPIDPATLVLT
ncbi:MAG: lactate utilization protein [Firmicutes bacterium]|nr:lactate utilization protein [Bacillota bacterium]